MATELIDVFGLNFICNVKFPCKIGSLFIESCWLTEWLGRGACARFNSPHNHQIVCWLFSTPNSFGALATRHHRPRCECEFISISSYLTTETFTLSSSFLFSFSFQRDPLTHSLFLSLSVSFFVPFISSNFFVTALKVELN